MGVERPPSSFFFHRTLLPSPPSGFHFSASPFSIETRFCCGPRQFGQSSGSAVAAKPLPAIGTNQDTTNSKIARLLERRLIRGLSAYELNVWTGNFAVDSKLARPSNFTLAAMCRVGQGAGSGCFRLK